MDSIRFPQFAGETSAIGSTPKPYYSFTGPSNESKCSQIPIPNSDPQIPLVNLSVLNQKMDFLRKFLSDSIESKSEIDNHQIDLVSTEITDAIQQVISNGAALVSSSPQQIPDLRIGDPAVKITEKFSVPISRAFRAPVTQISSKSSKTADVAGQMISPVVLPDPPIIHQIAVEIGSDLKFPAAFSASEMVTTSSDLKFPAADYEIDNDCEIIELDAVELLAEHIHFCEICGKGFKRDANLRMHMRAHGNRFKTLEALTKPDRPEESYKKTRFSCPFPGCSRNRSHSRFKPLKSAVCVKNHFKRSHCPKMYSCNRCNKKSFSVVSDLKNHLKHCGECRWKCSCGTSFSRKDKLFGHIALFEGHMPAIVGDEEKGKMVVEEEIQMGDLDSDSGFFASLLQEFESIDGSGFEGLLGL